MPGWGSQEVMHHGAFDVATSRGWVKIVIGHVVDPTI